MAAKHEAGARRAIRVTPAAWPRTEQRLGWSLCAPAVGVMLAVTALPMLQALWLSLQSYRITDPGSRRFVGLDNYALILADPLWWHTVGVTLLITAITVSAALVIGFALALVMHRITFGRDMVRTAILVPYGIVTIVSAYAWLYAFRADSGFVPGWLGVANYDFFAGFGSSLFVICLSEIWKTTPFVSLLLLAGLAQIPTELYEAAKVDGATARQRLWKITLPNMRGAIMVAVLFRTLDAYRIFDNVFVMTGGANGTETVAFLAYRQIISRTAIGLGAAVSVLLFLTVVLIAFVLVKAFRADLSRIGHE
ncbi:MAG TPA: sugar ABC transporter permease [Steroidobacter sp.]|nr:sugar ABC transporter permease [Steroidobacter sp.]